MLGKEFQTALEDSKYNSPYKCETEFLSGFNYTSSHSSLRVVFEKLQRRTTMNWKTSWRNSFRNLRVRSLLPLKCLTTSGSLDLCSAAMATFECLRRSFCEGRSLRKFLLTVRLRKTSILTAILGTSSHYFITKFQGTCIHNPVQAWCFYSDIQRNF